MCAVLLKSKVDEKESICLTPRRWMMQYLFLSISITVGSGHLLKVSQMIANNFVSNDLKQIYFTILINQGNPYRKDSCV